MSRIAWTADGAAIVFRAKRFGDEHQGIWRIPVDGGEARKLVEDPDGDEAKVRKAFEKIDTLRKKLVEHHGRKYGRLIGKLQNEEDPAEKKEIAAELGKIQEKIDRTYLDEVQLVATVLDTKEDRPPGRDFFIERENELVLSMVMMSGEMP